MLGFLFDRMPFVKTSTVNRSIRTMRQFFFHINAMYLDVIKDLFIHQEV